MSDDKKMTKEEEEILAKDGEPASDEELEQVAGGAMRDYTYYTTCRFCHKEISSTSAMCPYCFRRLI